MVCLKGSQWGGQASQGELLFIWNEPLGKQVTWQTGPGQLLKWTGLRKEMGGGRKEGCLQRKWEQWPLSALFHPLPPFLSHIERAQKVFGYRNTPWQTVRTTEFLYLLNIFVESFRNHSFTKLNSPWKITTHDKNKPLPLNGDPLRVLMTGTGLCNKSNSAAIPHRSGIWCAEGGPGLCCLQSLDPSFEAASVFQQLTTFRWDCGVLWAE